MGDPELNPDKLASESSSPSPHSLLLEQAMGEGISGLHHQLSCPPSRRVCGCQKVSKMAAGTGSVTLNRALPVSPGISDPTYTTRELGELMFVAAFASTDLAGCPGPRGLTLLPTLAIKYGWGVQRPGWA